MLKNYRRRIGRRAGSFVLAAAMAVTCFGGVSLYQAKPEEAQAAETISTNDELKLRYDEPATADFYEIFASKYSFIEWYQDGAGNWVSKGDGWLEFGRGDAQNYTDNKNHSKSSKGPDGTWDVTDAVKQGVAWAKHALPVGNGNMGAMSFGYTDTEIVQMNQNTLWTGGPNCAPKLASNNNADAYGNTKIEDPGAKMQKLIDDGFAEFYSSMESGELPKSYAASPYSNGFTPNSREQEGAYQSFCEMNLDFGHPYDQVRDYSRTLDLNTAVSSVSYTYDGVGYQRDLFASYPDNVIVYKVAATEKGKVNFTLQPEIPQMGLFEGRYNGTADNGKDHYGKTGTVVANGDTITLSGALNHNGMKFAGEFKVVTTGGTMEAKNEENNAAADPLDHGSITVSGADEAYIIVSLKTDYVNDFDKNYTTGETLEQVAARAKEQVAAAAALGYEQLYANHEADYTELFGRVKLDLGGTTTADVMTDELIDAYKQRDYSQYLETLYYQYGRYLLISSSREGGLPANLQGLWNDTDGPAWNSDYHTNINLQMNYWLAESTNLAETATALVDFANSLRKPGRLTFAKSYGIGYDSDDSKIDLNTEDGFVFFCSTNPLGFTGNINSNASFTQTATAFLGQNLYDYYAFTKDVDYLKSDIYPYLRESCISYLLTLEPGRMDYDKDKLYVAPSWSSEQGPWTIGTYFDQQLVWQEFHDTIEVMKDLGITPAENMADEGTDTFLTNDSKLMARLIDALDRLDPVEISRIQDGGDGQIKEWQQEVTYVRTKDGTQFDKGQGDQHRHISSLMALYPGNYISKDDTELLDAAKVVMENRGDSSTGWGEAYRLNLWARTGDGNHAYKIVNALLSDSTYDNLFDTHAPFQIDGNFGATAGITEMLLQSQDGKVELLPALPNAWKSGSVEGLVARGNFVVDMTWEDKVVTKAEITSRAGGELKVQGLALSNVYDSAANPVAFTENGDGTYSIETTEGESYTLMTTGEVPTPAPTDEVPTPMPSDKPITGRLYGDIDGNGSVEAKDALDILKHVVKLTQFTDEIVLKAADVDHDGEIQAPDALETLKVVVKLREAEEMTL